MIAAYYAGISPRLADAFWAELLEAIDDATAHPERHHFDPSGRRRANLRKFPYHFLFRTFPDQIRVIVVRHNRRDPHFGSRRA
ncbi:MAG: hypothetical protein H7A44_02730 [Opitutaceae bacterium]|nr:hypothetical protein [Cephaloticoccus sp.]MCP5529331.1 hypothetical protein [Opitutaceae bacterium]